MGNKYWDKNSKLSYKNHIDGVDMNRMQKLFVAGMVGGHGEGVFSFAIDDGEEKHGYAAIPRVMKSVVTWMTEQVRQYEEKFGEIEMEE